MNPFLTASTESEEIENFAGGAGMSLPNLSQKVKKLGSTKGILRVAEEALPEALILMFLDVKATLIVRSSLPLRASSSGITLKGIWMLQYPTLSSWKFACCAVPLETVTLHRK